MKGYDTWKTSPPPEDRRLRAYQEAYEDALNLLHSAIISKDKKRIKQALDVFWGAIVDLYREGYLDSLDEIGLRVEHIREAVADKCYSYAEQLTSKLPDLN